MRSASEMMSLMRGTVGLSIEDFSPYERAVFFDEAVGKCPFCGGRPVYAMRHGSYSVRCSVCGARGPRNRTFIRAVLGWNKAVRL